MDSSEHDAGIGRRLDSLREELAAATAARAPAAELSLIRAELAGALVEWYETGTDSDPAVVIARLAEAVEHAERALTHEPSDAADARYARFTAGLARLHLFGEREDRADIDAAISHLAALEGALAADPAADPAADEAADEADWHMAARLLGVALAARYRWEPAGEAGREADLSAAIRAWELARELAGDGGAARAELALELGLLYYDRHQRGQDVPGTQAAADGHADLDAAVALYRQAAGDPGADPDVGARAAFCLGEILTGRVTSGSYSAGELAEGIAMLARFRATPGTDDEALLAIAAFYHGTLLWTQATGHDGTRHDRREAIAALREAVALDLPADMADLARLLLGQILMMPLPPAETAGLLAPAQVGREQVGRVMDVLTADATQDDAAEAIRQLSQIGPELRADPANGGTIAGLLGAAMLASGARGMSVGDLDLVIGRLAEATRLSRPASAELACVYACCLAERALHAGHGDQVPSAMQDPAQAHQPLERALQALERALDALGDRPHALRHTVLHYLGVLRGLRGSLRGDPEDLAAGITALTEALALMAEDHPARSETLGALGAALMNTTVFKSPASLADRAIGVLSEALARPHPDPAKHALHLCCYGQALHMRAIVNRSHDDFAAAADALRQAEREVPDGHPRRAYILLTLAGMLSDQYDHLGSLESLDAAEYYLGELEQLAEVAGGPAFRPGTGADLWSVRATRGHIRLRRASRQDGTPLDGAISDLEFAVRHAPPWHPMRPRLVSDLGAARLGKAAFAEDAGALLAAVGEVIDAAADVPAGHPDLATLTTRAGAMLTGLGVTGGDLGALDRGIALYRQVADAPGILAAERSRVRWGVGNALLQRHEVSRARADIDAAVTWLEDARRDLASEPGTPIAALVLATLAEALRARGDRALGDPRHAIEAGLAALREQASDVLLQAGTDRALTMARMAWTDAVEVASWCRAEGDATAAAQALELGRGLALHAATSVRSVAEALRDAGHGELAAQWAAADGAVAGRDAMAAPWNRPAGEAAGGIAGQAAAAAAGRLARRGVELLADLPGIKIPSDLRHRVLLALEASGLDRKLLAPPPTAQVAAAMRATGTDLLAYLVAAGEHGDGFAIVLRPDGSAQDLPLPALNAWPGGVVDACAAAQRDALAAEAAPPDGTAPHGTPARGTPAHGTPPHGTPPHGTTTADARERWSRCLRDLCDWAWAAATGPLLDAAGRDARGSGPRIVLIPVGLLGTVPWHAASRRRPGEPTAYACQRAALSYAASARQFIDAANRPGLPLSAGQFLVADPVGGNIWASWEARALHAAFYPDAALLGRRRPWATPGSVLAALPGGEPPSGTAVLHLSCHGRTGTSPAASHLRLRGTGEAGGEQHLAAGQVLLQAARVPDGAPGGLVVLSACVSDLAASDYDEAMTLASAFLTAGAADVVGTRWQVPDMRTAILMFVFHAHLRAGQPPDVALRRAQEWMLAPDREVPAGMPAVLAQEVPLSDLADPIAWAGFVHQGGNRAICPQPGHARSAVMTPDAIDALAGHWDEAIGLLADADRASAEDLAREVRDARDPASRREAALDLLEFLAPLLPAEHPVRAALRSESSKYATAAPGLDLRIDALRERLASIAPGPGAQDAGPGGAAGHEPGPDPAEEWLLQAPSLDEAQVRESGADPGAGGLLRIGTPGQAPRYPRFQFDQAGLPRPVVTRINLMLDAQDDPWGVADWWLGPNAWLGAAPADLLGQVADDDLLSAAAAVLEEA